MANPRKASPKRKASPNSPRPVKSDASTKPVFPYSTRPNSLRKFLETVPKKPKPTKVNVETLRAWGLKDTND